MTRPRLPCSALLLAMLCALAGCVPPGGQHRSLRAVQQEGFWQRLVQLCGRDYPGRMVEGSDSVFLRYPLRLRVRSCGADEVRMGFAIGADTTRSWLVRREASGLRLRHVVRAEDGTEERISGYGGVTTGPGTARRQEFSADSATARLLPQAATNRWLLEIDPGHALAYSLGRPGTPRRFRLEFDLSRGSASRAGVETNRAPRP